MSETKFTFGDRVRDIYTGFEGTVLACTHYHTGCTHWGIQPDELLDKDGKERSWVWLDETRLERVNVSEMSTGKPIGGTGPTVLGGTAPVGGPAPNPPNM